MRHRLIGVLGGLALLSAAAHAQNPTALSAAVTISAQDAGACATANACADFAVQSAPSFVFDVSGTWSGTLTFECRANATYTAVQPLNTATGTAASTTTANGIFSLGNFGFDHCRVRAGTFASGSAVVALRNGYFFAKASGGSNLSNNGSLTFGSQGALTNTADGAFKFTNNASALGTLSVAGLTATGGTVTASAPVFNVTQTWNNGAVAFTGVNMNYTVTAADVSSKYWNISRNNTPVLWAQHQASGYEMLCGNSTGTPSCIFWDDNGVVFATAGDGTQTTFGARDLHLLNGIGSGLKTNRDFLVAVRNNTDTADLHAWDVGATAVDEAVFGGLTGATRIQSSLATPGAPLSNGEWWVDCSGTSPSRVCAVKVRDGGATHTIASVTF